MPFPFMTLGPGEDRADIEAAIRRVIDRGWFVLVPERRLRNGGQADRCRHVEAGVNSRLDEMQAAILRARLPRLAGWTARRRSLAARYRTALAETPVGALPECDRGHVYHLFTVHSTDRDGLQAALAADGVGTLVHYPNPLYRRPAFADLRAAACPVADTMASSVPSLPLHPALAEADVDAVAAAVRTLQPAPERAAASR